MDWILELKVPIFLALTLVITILGCFIALYAFHASTKGNHFREWKEFEVIDAATNTYHGISKTQAIDYIIEGLLTTYLPELRTEMLPHYYKCGFISSIGLYLYGSEWNGSYKDRQNLVVFISQVTHNQNNPTGKARLITAVNSAISKAKTYT